MKSGYATSQQVAEFLGMSLRNVKRITGVREEDLPCYKFGKRMTRYNWEDVYRWAKQHLKKAESVW